ncbi:hypothetical protein I6A84_01830 [Frankia sp. CNm7]|uniref:Uncharacterized protein n=1 Tax=Frankia nepalensis TaxID=1836974 RepID=A0A937RL73_9ACTN|nr:hypothetical protein [Frankia nepalensis]MBL7498167.1 hypothetical protein [Frankia nepalensis]MBL7509315.1 hypothetical protein [Frankia nepalensis]MBL7516897.1 hypothetical protein [Frankia nepalensis]MBL7627956.1 hypothetical protein [Frankia nepalensis]
MIKDTAAAIQVAIEALVAEYRMAEQRYAKAEQAVSDAAWDRARIAASMHRLVGRGPAAAALRINPNRLANLVTDARRGAAKRGLTEPSPRVD